MNKDLELAKNLELRGTPVFIINDEIFFGYIGYEAIAENLIKLTIQSIFFLVLNFAAKPLL